MPPSSEDLSRRSLRSVRISPWFCSFILLFIIGAVWALTTPPYGAPDEASHIIKASSVGAGNLFPEAQAEYLGGGGVDTRQRLSAYNVPVSYSYEWLCFIGKTTKTPKCAGDLIAKHPSESIATYVGGYPPLYYGLVGWPASVFPAPQSFYLMRLASAALVAAFTASAMQSALARRRSRLLLLGVLVSITPDVFSLGGSINPNGFEIAAAICFWATLLVLLTEPEASLNTTHYRRLILRATISGSALALARPISPLFVILITATVLLLARRDLVKQLIRLRTTWAGIALLTLAGTVAGVWTITQEPNQDFIHYAPGVARPDLLLTLRELFGHVPNHLRDMIGLFGWYELVPPASTLIAWIGSLAVITVLAFAISKRREQITLLALAFTIVLLPAILYIFVSETNGPGWVGRYGMPLAVGFPLIGALILDHHREKLGGITKGMTTFIVIAIGVGQLTAYAKVAHRYIVGTLGPILYPLRSGWSPPLPAWLLLVSIAIALFTLTWWVRNSITSERGSPIWDRPADVEDRAIPGHQEGETEPERSRSRKSHCDVDCLG